MDERMASDTGTTLPGDAAGAGGFDALCEGAAGGQMEECGTAVGDGMVSG